MYKLIEGDVFEKLPHLPKCQCLVADPPDAIGNNYENSKDNMSEDDYRCFLRRCLGMFSAKAPIVWISYNSRWLNMMGSLMVEFLEANPDYETKTFMQTFTFGQNNNRDCGSGYRPILRIKHKDAPLYPDQIRVPSWRQLHGDKRANPSGRVPLDVWAFPRVTGNSSQRRKWHPTQLHEGLVARMINLSTQAGGTVLDVFSGTGTTLRVCKELNRHCFAIESDSFYCNKLREEHEC